MFLSGTKVSDHKKELEETRFLHQLLSCVSLASLPLCCPGTSSGVHAHRHQVSATPSRTVGTQVTSPCPTPCLRWQYHSPSFLYGSHRKLGHCCHGCLSTFSRVIFFGLLHRSEVPAPGTRDVFSFSLVHLGRSQLPSATQSPSVHRGSDALSLTTARADAEKCCLRHCQN